MTSQYPTEDIGVDFGSKEGRTSEEDKSVTSSLPFTFKVSSRSTFLPPISFSARSGELLVLFDPASVSELLPYNVGNDSETT